MADDEQFRPAPAQAQRNRRTVHLQAVVFAALLDQAVAAETQRLQQSASGDGAACTEGHAGSASDPAAVRANLLALLKAFVDAARPAGGLPLDAAGKPRNLPALFAAGRALARSGEVAPRLLTRLRTGQPVDLRIAQAALHFFRLVLDKPVLALEHIGAVESDRQRAVEAIAQAIRAARDDLPASILEGLLRRAQEAAAHTVVMNSYVREYRDLRMFTDAHGVRRIALMQTTRYRPLRLVSFDGAFRPVMAAEWYQWSQVGAAAGLWVSWLSGQGQLLRRESIAIRKRFDRADGIVLFEIDPGAHPALAANGLPANDADGRAIAYEFDWQIPLVLNAADRDLVVSYLPVNAPRIVFEAGTEQRFVLQVGDSPGLERTADGWQLNRTLMAREVLAVRIRSRELQDDDALRLSPSGEWRAGSAGPDAGATPS